jgi:putative DNA primase/helicase
VVSLQGIFEDRDGDFRKLYLKHGAKEGKFCPLKGANEQALLICEGLATGLSLLQCTDYTVIVAFDAGNLLPVARLMRELRPRACILVCADNDSWTAGAIKNPGIHHATRAAAAVGGLVAFPQFADISTQPTDFNDLHQLEDEEAVSTVISRALAAGKVAGPNASSSETFGSDFHVR